MLLTHGALKFWIIVGNVDSLWAYDFVGDTLLHCPRGLRISSAARVPRGLGVSQTVALQKEVLQTAMHTRCKAPLTDVRGCLFKLTASMRSDAGSTARRTSFHTQGSHSSCIYFLNVL